MDTTTRSATLYKVAALVTLPNGAMGTVDTAPLPLEESRNKVREMREAGCIIHQLERYECPHEDLTV